MNRKFALILFILITIAGCNDPIRSKITGTWQMQRPEKILDRVSESGDSNESETGMKLIFLANGTFMTVTKMGAIDQSKQGRWTLIGFDAASNVMTVNFSLQSQNSEHEIEFVDDNQIRLVPPNMAGLSMKVQFERTPD